VIVDDILDSGATLVSACENLVAAGAEELYICVTHGLFTGKAWHNLWSLPVSRFFARIPFLLAQTSEIPGSPCSQSHPFCAKDCCGPVARQKRLPRRPSSSP
jgi:Phosphoribosyl synthetase-associated domain